MLFYIRILAILAISFVCTVYSSASGWPSDDVWPNDAWPGDAWSTDTWPFTDDAASGVGTDFSEDANALGCWLKFDDGAQASAGTDRCTDDNDDSLTFTGTWAGPQQPGDAPAGSAANQDSAYFDGANTWFSLVDDNRFEAANFSLGCWVNHRNDQTGVMFTKDDVDNWELRVEVGTRFVSWEVTNKLEVDANTMVDETWELRWVRFDGTGTSPDATDDEVEVFFNGVKNCGGVGCKASSDPTGNAEPIIIGANEGGDLDFKGWLLECVYLNRVLTNVEMQEIALCGFFGDADGAVREANFGNGACVGAADPFACCTGAGTGTCASCDNIDTCC